MPIAEELPEPIALLFQQAELDLPTLATLLDHLPCDAREAVQDIDEQKEPIPDLSEIDDATLLQDIVDATENMEVEVNQDLPIAEEAFLDFLDGEGEVDEEDEDKEEDEDEEEEEEEEEDDEENDSSFETPQPETPLPVLFTSDQIQLLYKGYGW